MTNWLAWRDIDGEVVYIRSGDSGTGILGPQHTRVCLLYTSPSPRD